MTLRRYPALLVLALCPLWGACSGDGARSDGEATPVRGGTVVVGSPSDFDYLSMLSGDKYTQDILRHALYVPLLRYDEDIELAAGLAESWEMIGDTGAVFSLRRDVRWHDGTPTTAVDVVFTIERALDPRTTYPNTDYLAGWTGVELVDSYTVRVRFARHAQPLAGAPFLPIMPRHLLDSIPPERLRQAAFNKAPTGNGPFRFVEYRANDRTVFVANDSYPEALGGRPHVDRLIYRVISEQAAQSTEIRTGGIDLALGAPAGDFARLDSLPAIRGIARPTREFAFVGWNGRRPGLDDPRVRRALAMGVDREEIIALRYGYGELAVGPVPSYHWAFPDDIAPLPYAPDSARALLAQAGITDRDGDAMLESPDGRDFTIELKAPASSEFNRAIAEVVRGQLAQIGVEVRVRLLDYSTLVRDLSTRDFDAFIMAWEGDFRLNLRNTFHSAEMDGLYQFAGYANPAVDSLIDAAALETDPERARPLFARLQRIMRDEQPWMFLYYYEDLFLARERVQNLEMDRRGAFVNVTEWWLSDQAGPAPGDSAARSPSPDSVPGQ